METSVYKGRLRAPNLGLRSSFPDSRALNRVKSLELAQSRRQRSFGDLKWLWLRRRTSPLVVFVVDSVSRADSKSVGSSTIEKPEAPTPVYLPTPPNRPLRTPHSGYHFDGTTRKFFEGWYFKVSIPERRQSFCFMYSVENPAFRTKLNRLEEAQHGPRFTGVGAQILGADGKYICQYTEESHNFWGSKFFNLNLLTCCSSFFSPKKKNKVKLLIAVNFV